MRRESGNGQGGSPQRTHAARLPPRQQGYIELVSDWRSCRLAVEVGCRPVSHECCPCDPNVLSVPLPISDDTGWRDRTDPARRPLPSADRERIIYADRLVLLDDLPAAFGGLPFQSVAGQRFGNRALPYKAPKLFLAFGSFARLNPSRHEPQLIPGPGWLT